MPLTTEQKARLRALTGADESATDDDLMTGALTELEAQKADLTTAAEQINMLSRERDTAKQELSRAAKPAREPDPDVLADRAALKREKVEHLITTGAISKHQGDFLLSRIEKDGKPIVFNLSRNGADESPIDALLAFAAMKGEGVKANGEAQTGVQELSRKSQQPKDHEAPTAERLNELRGYVQLPAK